MTKFPQQEILTSSLALGSPLVPLGFSWVCWAFAPSECGLTKESPFTETAYVGTGRAVGSRWSLTSTILRQFLLRNTEALTPIESSQGLENFASSQALATVTDFLKLPGQKQPSSGLPKCDKPARRSTTESPLQPSFAALQDQGCSPSHRHRSA